MVLWQNTLVICLHSGEHQVYKIRCYVTTVKSADKTTGDKLN